MKALLMNRVVNAVALPGGCLQVVLADGRSGEFDVKPFMGSEFFSQLKNEDYFKKVGLFFAGVGWPAGQDLSPDTIAANLKTTQALVN